MARNGQGTTGLIPRNYVRELGRQLSGEGGRIGPTAQPEPTPQSALDMGMTVFGHMASGDAKEWELPLVVEC